MKKFRVWVDVPHYIEVEAENENKARSIASDKEFKDLKPGWLPDDIVGEEAQGSIEVLKT